MVNFYPTLAFFVEYPLSYVIRNNTLFGKVPKLLLHRLFPNTRFSIWIDGKLQLVVDPYQILERYSVSLFTFSVLSISIHQFLVEQLCALPFIISFLRFLWRQNATFAISKHYIRFDVFEEAEANKAGGKYDNASIDYQIEFYKNEGLTPYTTAKLPIISGTYMTGILSTCVASSGHNTDQNRIFCRCAWRVCHN